MNLHLLDATICVRTRNKYPIFVRCKLIVELFDKITALGWNKGQNMLLELLHSFEMIWVLSFVSIIILGNNENIRFYIIVVSNSIHHFFPVYSSIQETEYNYSSWAILMSFISTCWMLIPLNMYNQLLFKKRLHYY